MTTLYRPVLIESAEQAEVLPEGTFVVRANGRTPKKRKNGTWGDIWGDCGLFDILTWTAYVPIEAEEEWCVGREAPAWAPGTEEWAREFQAHEPGRRLFRRSTTPWEEA